MSSYSRKAGANDDCRDEWHNTKRHQLSYTLLYNSVQREKPPMVVSLCTFLLSICSEVGISLNVFHLLWCALLHKIVEIFKQIGLNCLKFVSNNRFFQSLLLFSRLFFVFLHLDCICSTAVVAVRRVLSR